MVDTLGRRTIGDSGIGPRRGASSFRQRTETPSTTAQSVQRSRRRRHDFAVLLTAEIVAVTMSTLVLSDRASGFLLAGISLVVIRALSSDGQHLSLSAFDDASRICVAVIIAMAVTVLVSSQWDLTPVDVTQAMAIALATLGMRALAYACIRRSRIDAEPLAALIVGGGSVGTALVDILHEHREYGLRPVGILDDLDGDDTTVGRLRDLHPTLDRFDVGCVIVAFGPARDAEIVSVVRASLHRGLDVFVVPRFFDVGVLPSGPRVESLWGIPVYRVRRAAHMRRSWRLKRLLDLLTAGTVLALLSPLLAGVAVAVRTSSPGPILFRQRRIGQHGRPFDMVKFRSMRVNDDSDTQWSVVDDDRLTSVGRWLRRTSIDELPQLWNVVRGDMSIVGPRPERPVFVDQYSEAIDGYNDRHRLPVGLTGLAQVNGLRGDTSIEERARLDNQYVEQWSPLLDLAVVARTVKAVFSHAREPDA